MKKGTNRTNLIFGIQMPLLEVSPLGLLIRREQINLIKQLHDLMTCSILTASHKNIDMAGNKSNTSMTA